MWVNICGLHFLCCIVKFTVFQQILTSLTQTELPKITNSTLITNLVGINSVFRVVRECEISRYEPVIHSVDADNFQFSV